MKYVVTALILGLSALAGLGCQESGRRAKTEPQTQDQSAPATEADDSRQATSQDAPLLLEQEPLLLSDEGATASVSGGADNSRCHVCHINFSQEELAAVHAQVAIGCAGCHGASDAHIADESWASGGNGTAPNTMFPKDKINPFCMGCHTANMPKQSQHEEIVAGNSDKVCTDCHGKQHRLPLPRKCKWK